MGRRKVPDGIAELRGNPGNRPTRRTRAKRAAASRPPAAVDVAAETTAAGSVSTADAIVPAVTSAAGTAGEGAAAVAGGEASTRELQLAALEASAPEYLSETARKIWARMRAAMAETRLLRSTDQHAFGRWCQYTAEWIEVCSKLARLGPDKRTKAGKIAPVYETESRHGKMLRVHPLFVVRERLEDNLVKLEDRMGFNPAMRQRLILQLAGNLGAGVSAGGGDLFDDNPAVPHRTGDDTPPPPAADNPVGALAPPTKH